MATLEDIAAQIKELSPPSRLRLAAELLERGQARIAHSIAECVVLELGAAMALRELDAREQKGGAR